MIQWQQIDLSAARDLVTIGGPGKVIGLYLVGATVFPTIILEQNERQEILVVDRMTVRNDFKRVFITNDAGAGTLVVGIAADKCEDIALGGGGVDPNAGVFFDAFWGPLQALPTTALVANMWLARGVPILAPAFWTSFTAGAGLAPQINIRNIPCFQTRGNAGLSGLQFAVGNIPWIRQFNNPGAGGAIINPTPDPATQSWIIEWLWRKDQNVFTKGERQGFVLIPASNILPGMPSGNTAFFGVTTDGVGSMRFASRVLTGFAGLDINDGFQLPNAGDATRWNRSAIQLVNADQHLGRDGIVRVYLNAALIREYRDMTKFPGTWDSGGAGNETGYTFVLEDEGSSADNIQVAQTRVRAFAGEGLVY